MLHAEHTLVALGVDRLEDTAIVDLAGQGLLPAGNIPDLEVRDLVPIPSDVVDQVGLFPGSGSGSTRFRCSCNPLASPWANISKR